MKLTRNVKLFGGALIALAFSVAYLSVATDRLIRSIQDFDSSDDNNWNIDDRDFSLD